MNKTFWLDAEFNGHGGELISVALIAEDDSGWYRAVVCNNPIVWVAQNVMPILNTKPIEMADLQDSLSEFLSDYSHVTIIADWPADIEHFCRLLISKTHPNKKIKTPSFTLEYKPHLRGKGVSAKPHNALEDAKANMLYDLSLQSQSWSSKLITFFTGKKK